jgi:Divergent InlB B-repeat domain
MIAVRRSGRLALPLLVALVAFLALAPSAPAAGPYVLEVSGAIDGTGFGEVACEFKVEGFTEVEQPCEELEFETKKLIKLIPVPELGSEFAEFKNGTGSAAICNGMTKACSFTLEADSYVEAEFDEITPSLVVKTSGEGEVSCVVEGSLPEVCEDEYEFETEVTLVPEPEEGWEFAGFKNGTGSASQCNGLVKPCAFLLEKDSTVDATFVPIMRSLTVKKSGTGSGTVASEPAGINCGFTCTAKFAQGSKVTLKATPASGSTFAGWSGEGCTGTGTCVVALEEANATVTATFTSNSVVMRSLTVKKSGSGTVASEPAGIGCGSTCSAKFGEGSEVTLKATPASGSTFAGWSGEGCTGTGTCVVKVGKADAAVTATFTANSKQPGPEEPKAGTATAGAVAKVKGSKARVRLTCSGGLCKGAVKLTAKLRPGAGPVVIGRTPFTLASGESAVLPVKLSAAAKRRVQKSGTLRAKAAGTGVAARALKLKLARP